jgi:hypothetical protein
MVYILLPFKTLNFPKHDAEELRRRGEGGLQVLVPPSSEPAVIAMARRDMSTTVPLHVTRLLMQVLSGRGVVGGGLSKSIYLTPVALVKPL